MAGSLTLATKKETESGGEGFRRYRNDTWIHPEEDKLLHEEERALMKPIRERGRVAGQKAAA